MSPGIMSLLPAPTATPAARTNTDRDGFCQERPSPLAAALTIVGEIALAALLIAFLTSPVAITPQHRLLLLVFGLSLPVAAWGVFTARFRSSGWRLWLVAAAGLVLSLSVKGENLARPPAPLAAACAIACGAAGILAWMAARRRIPAIGIEAGAAATVLLIILIPALLFRPVATQNSLDNEVLRNLWGTLLDYLLLVCGAAVVSCHRGSYARMAIVLAVGCLVRVFLHHAAPGG